VENGAVMTIIRCFTGEQLNSFRWPSEGLKLPGVVTEERLFRPTRGREFGEQKAVVPSVYRVEPRISTFSRSDSVKRSERWTMASRIDR